MKVPLRYQVTKYDCGAAALTNAVSYLLDFEKIPPELIKGISSFTLDSYDKDGDLGEGGTSREAIKFLCHWINNYAQTNEFNINCKYYEKEQVTVNLIKKCINQGGVILLRTYQEGEHYVTLTDIDDNNVYLFDPYYFEEDYYQNNDMIKMVSNQPFKYNRIVKLERLESQAKEEFALGPISKRECVHIYKKSS